MSRKYIGTNNDDHFMGSPGDDLFYLRDGDDSVYAGAGADTIHGGNGIDLVNFLFIGAVQEGVWVDLENGTGSRGDAEGDRYFSIENVLGTASDDVIIGNNDDNRLDGWDGNDVLKGGGGADDLWGQKGDDTIKGGGGDDILDGGWGINTLIGGEGDDVYYAYSEDTLVESVGEGHDFVYARATAASAWIYKLQANIEDMWLLNGTTAIGNNLSNTITGNELDNVLNGGGGADTLDGAIGLDTFVFQRGEAHGDRVHNFLGNGAGAGDVLRFHGYGTVAEGATFRQLTATEWQITSSDGLIQETITFVGGYSLETTTDLIFVPTLVANGSTLGIPISNADMAFANNADVA